MSGLVKNQIVKQLARFTKNLSPNKISVKFLKGEGELHNLELDETTLSELLELPPWIRLTKAVCNRISAKIHWTRLKTDPICLYLDCVEVNMEAVDSDVNTPPPSSPQKQPSHAPQQPPKEKAPNRYGFVEKVVDGMFVQINSVIISFKFQAFLATFQMSRLYIQSTNPKWQADDLRMTRVKDETRGEVLTFKEITWSTLRIDANALYNEKSDQQSPPLRLITSHSALHITIKKRLEDCAVLSARLEFLLDDILWVLTQSQLEALAGLLHSVTQAMSQTQTQKMPGTNPGQPAGQVTQQQQSHYASNAVHEHKTDIESLNALFTQHDVRETSYHVRTGCIDLHLCDDSDQDNGSDGGAMHLQINKLSVDYYPYHLAGTSRTDWPCHNEASLTRAYWVNELLNAFRNSQRNKQMSPQRATQTHHRARSDSSLVGADGRERLHHPPSPLSTPPSPRVNPKRHNPSSPGQSSRQSAHSIRNNLQRPVFMLESCFVVRCEEFSIMPVTTSNVTKEATAFISSDKKALYLPTDMPAFQLDFTQYYYPGPVGSPVPCPNVFIQLNPIQLTLDTATCLWFNRFIQSILGQRTWSMGSPEQFNTPSSHIDIRIEALMPKIVIPCQSDPCAAYKESRPQALQLQASQVFLTNSRTGYKSTQTDMLMFLQHFLGSRVYTDFHSFPALNSDVHPLPNSSWVNDCSLLVNNGKVDKLLNGVCHDFYDTHHPSQVWCLSAEQVWLDFLGIEETNNRPMPFIDAVPIQMWIATPVPTYDKNSTNTQVPVRRTQSASPLNSPTHGRTSSEVISPRRKVSEPVIAGKFRANAAAPSSMSPKFNGLHNSDPGLTSSPEVLTSVNPSDLSAIDGPPPAYEPRNAAQKPFPAASEPPPPYEALTYNGPTLAGPPLEEAPPLPEKTPLSEDVINGLTKTEGRSHQDLDSASRADLSLLIHIPQCVKVQLDHFQFVFLMRLQEMLVKLQEDLEKDQLTQNNHISGLTESGDSQPAVFFSILAQEVVVNVVLPPAPDRGTSRLDRNPSQSTSRNASSLSSYLDTGIVSDSGCQSPDVVNFKSHSRTDSDGAASQKDGFLSTTESRNPRTVQEHLSLSRPSSAPSASHTSGRASASSALDSDGWLMVAGNDSKTTSGHVQSRTDSDASNINQMDSRTSNDSNSKDIEKESKEHKMVSILSIQGEEVEVGIHFHRYDKAIKVICPEVKLEELGVINFDKYLNEKCFRKSFAKTTLSPPSEATPMVRMRAEFGPSAERFEPTAGERGFMHLKVNGVNGDLLVSTLGSIADCFEDEVLIPPMPFVVEVNNSNVSINNDLPPTLVSAPLAIPVDLNVENISVRRAHSGVFHIRPMSADSPACENDSDALPITRQESHASQLSLTDSASVCSRAESLENEKQCLVAQMAVSRATLQALQEERDALLKTIERLQQELSFSNREQDLLQEKMTSFQKGGRRGYR